MQENEFEKLALNTLDEIADALDELDEGGSLELEYENGMITITSNSNKQFVVTKHSPSRQIWLSSPISGGLHFSYNQSTGKWQLGDGRELKSLLEKELENITRVRVVLQ